MVLLLKLDFGNTDALEDAAVNIDMPRYLRVLSSTKKRCFSRVSSRQTLPAGGMQLEPSDLLTDLNARLSKDQLTIGDIAYPEVACRPEDNGGADHYERRRARYSSPRLS